MNTYNLVLGEETFPCRLSFKAQKALKHNSQNVPDFDGIDLLPWLFSVSMKADDNILPMNQEEVAAILFYSAWACNKELTYDEFEDALDEVDPMTLFGCLQPILETSGFASNDEETPKKGKKAASKN